MIKFLRKYECKSSFSLKPEFAPADYLRSHNCVLFNTMIYVFGERLNHLQPAETGMYKITRRMQDYVHGASMVSELINVILHAFESLSISGLLTKLKSTVADNGIECASGDKFLRFWVKFVAWKLGTFRRLDNFHELLKNPDYCTGSQLEPRPKLAQSTSYYGYPSKVYVDPITLTLIVRSTTRKVTRCLS